jgi:hypothetical protein
MIELKKSKGNVFDRYQNEINKLEYVVIELKEEYNKL